MQQQQIHQLLKEYLKSRLYLISKKIKQLNEIIEIISKNNKEILIKPQY